MRLVGWPTKYSEEEGLLPIDLQDVDFHGTPEELRALAEFLEKAADKLAEAEKAKQDLNVGIDFGDSKPNPKTGIWVNVVYHAA